MGEFSKEHNPETTIKRNSRDLSFSNNLTFNIGQIVPCFCKEVLPGDTFSIDTLFALNFFPTYFPIQNKIRADVHFFYCRTRNIYNEFKRFQSNVSVNKPMPYLAMTSKQHSEFRAGSIYDYFNIPVTRINPAGSLAFGDGLLDNKTMDYVTSSSPLFLVNNTSPSVGSPFSAGDKLSFYPSTSVYELYMPGPDNNPPVNSSFLACSHRADGVVSPSFILPQSMIASLSEKPLTIAVGWNNTYSSFALVPVITYSVSGGRSYALILESESIAYSIPSRNKTVKVPFSFPSFDAYVSAYNKVNATVGVIPESIVYGVSIVYASTTASTPQILQEVYSGFRYAIETVSNIGDSSISLNPFVKKPLNSSVFRCYESIYNSFFRDERNNPFLVNGEPAYDEYLTSTDGGPDNFDYKLHFRNWEQDWFTTALPTPQQGNAPLVGISSLGEVTVSTDDGQVFKAQAEYADDGDTITNVHYTPVNQDGTPMPNSVKRQLVSLATSGISINDFRNVNALQRYLETNIRRGLKYKDIMASRWGINISYAELNMPEFIGGVTEYVSPAQVNQTSQDTESSPLGSFAGQLYCKGQSKHSVRVFCDEPGYIIGLISVVPTPVYSQSLPKMFTKHSQLDFYNPEFGHIGLQPIPMLEVAPLQTPQSELDETFGYQRAWYDYLASLDEVHGQFRTSLRDFVMYRTYDSKPVLSEDFLLVSNRDVDNVFSVQRDSDGNSVDKVIGQVHFSVKTRRPIPKYGIPRLE